MRRILGNRDFRYIWLGGLLSATGSQVSRLGLILYIFQTSDSALQLASLVLLETLPGACIAPLAGAVVDAFGKRAVMIASDLARATFMLVVLLRPTLEVIYLMVALHSIARAFFQPAKAAAVPLVVSQEDLPRANGLDQSATNLAYIVGPIVGAELLLYSGLRVTLLIDACSFLASAILLTMVGGERLDQRMGKLTAKKSVADIKAGWHYMSEHRQTLHLNLLFFAGLFCVGIWMPIAPLFVHDHLDVSGRVLGWQIGMIGLGAVLGGLLAPPLVERYGKGRVFFAGLFCEAASLSAYALVFDVWLSLLITFAWGIAVSMFDVPFYSILQETVDERFTGRVFSVVKQSENAALMLAMLAAMWLQGLWGSYLILLVAGISYFGVTALSLLSKRGRVLLAAR